MPEQLTPEKTDIEKLQEIIAELPEPSMNPEERRRNVLTRDDVLIIYRIAKIAQIPHICPFEEDERDTLQGVAKSMNRTQKIASTIIIAAVITTVGSGIWYAIKHVFLEWVKVGTK